MCNMAAIVINIKYPIGTEVYHKVGTGVKGLIIDWFYYGRSDTVIYRVAMFDGDRFELFEDELVTEKQIV